jgi:hypothetical protein
VLLAASQDGTVAVLRFTDDQFAAAIPLAEVSSISDVALCCFEVHCMHTQTVCTARLSYIVWSVIYIIAALVLAWRVC